MEIIDRICVGLFIVLLAGMFLMFFITLSPAQHRPEDMELHEKFYSNWYRPDLDLRDPRGDPNGRRLNSCCNKQDCEPAEIVYQNGHYFAKLRTANGPVLIPDVIIEANQSDPRESPDGRSHVCWNHTTNAIYCAVLGSAT